MRNSHKIGDKEPVMLLKQQRSFKKELFDQLIKSCGDFKTR